MAFCPIWHPITSCVETARKVLSLTKSSTANVPEVRRLLNCLENDGHFLSNVAKEQIEELEGEETNLQCELREVNNMKRRHELDKRALEKQRSDMESSKMQHEKVLQHEKSKEKDAKDSLNDAKANLTKEIEKTESRLLKGIAGGGAVGLTGGAGSGAGLGAAIGIIGGPIGIAIGAAIGAAVGSVTGTTTGMASGTAIAMKYLNGKIEEADKHLVRCLDAVSEAKHKLEYIKASLESLKTKIQICDISILNAERRAAHAHKRIGAIKKSIAFMREAAYKWDLLKKVSQNATENTKHLQEIIQIADETKTYQIITSDGTTIELRSFLQAWEKVSTIRNLRSIVFK